MLSSTCDSRRCILAWSPDDRPAYGRLRLNTAKALVAQTKPIDKNIDRSDRIRRSNYNMLKQESQCLYS
jgi:hypothetical protein